MDPVEYWHSLLRPDIELSEPYWLDLAARMREARLTFGGRLNCPFLRPIFVSRADLARVSRIAETIAVIGERVAAAAVNESGIRRAAGLTDAEEALVAIDPGYGTASTASRLDSFLLPDALWFAEYNAESPAGLGYTQLLSELFDTLPITARFKEKFDASFFRLAEAILEALLASYREWGGRADPPVVAITDWREVPTWAEFEILRARFETRGVRTVVVDPRDLAFDGTILSGGGERIDLVYRRVLINDIVSRPDECRALVAAYSARAVCVANTFRCKVPHKKAFFALLTDPTHDRLMTAAERAVVRQHVPWTRLIGDGATDVDGTPRPLLDHLRQTRHDHVIKPNDEYGGTGVILGWETDEAAWDRAIAQALADPPGTWIAQRRIPVRREIFPMVDGPPHTVQMRDVLVDFAPYIFRGRVAGFLTRLSTSGLANVTSGGGQVPAFVVEDRR